MRYETESDAGFVTTTQPGRGAALEPDVWVPALQGALLGAAVGLGAGVIVLLLGGPVVGLRGGELWSWAGRVAGTVGVLTWAASTVWLVVDHRKLLWAVETTSGLDLDGDDQVGAPSVVRLQLEREGPGQRLQVVDLPVSDAQLYAVAVALKTGAGFSRPSLVDDRRVLSQGRFHKLARAMVKAGLARDLAGNQRELTGSGRALMRRVLEQ